MSPGGYSWGSANLSGPASTSVQTYRRNGGMCGMRFTNQSGSLLGIDSSSCYGGVYNSAISVSGGFYLQWNTYNTGSIGGISEPFFQLYNINGATKTFSTSEIVKGTGINCKMWARFSYDQSEVYPLGTIGNYLKDSSHSSLSGDNFLKATDAFGFFYKHQVNDPVTSISFTQASMTETPTVNEPSVTLSLQALQSTPAAPTPAPDYTWAIAETTSGATTLASQSVSFALDSTSAATSVVLTNSSGVSVAVQQYTLEVTVSEPSLGASTAVYNIVVDFQPVDCTPVTVQILDEQQPSATYLYSGSIVYKVQTQSSISPDCPVTHSCQTVSSPGSIDICSATSVFDTVTGTMTFATTDTATYPVGDYTIRITGTAENNADNSKSFVVKFINPDPCVVDGGLAVTASPIQDQSMYYKAGDPISVNTGPQFAISNVHAGIDSSSCSLSYECSAAYGAVTYSCSHSDNGHMVLDFDQTTGVFNADAEYDSAGYLAEGTNVITIKGISGDAEDTSSFNLIVSCSITSTDLSWNIAQAESMDEVVSVGVTGWTFTPFLIDPISPPTVAFASSTSCTNLDFESWTRQSEILNASGTVDSTSTVTLATDLSDSAVTVNEQLYDWAQVETYCATIKNMQNPVPGVQHETCLSRTVVFVDGLTLITCSGYSQGPTTIDLASGSAIASFTSPIFVDHNGATVTIDDPTNPLREIYYKVAGQSSADPTSFVTATTVDNTMNSQISVLFEKTTSQISDTVELVTCYNYGSYSQLQDLCDETNVHTLINAEGACFTDLTLTLNEATSSGLMKTPFSFEIGQEPAHLFDLTDVVGVMTDPSLSCGQFNFKLDLQSQYLEAFMSVSPDGAVLIDTSTLIDETLLGSFSASFEVFLADIDPSALRAKPLTNFQIEVIIDPAPTFDAATQAWIIGRLVRKKPVAVEPIEPLYTGYADANATQVYVFEFADTLAIARDRAEIGDLTDQEIGGLEIILTANEIPYLVKKLSIDYAVVGYGTLKLTIDRNEAWLQLEQQKKESGDPALQPQIEGAMTVVVKDLSPFGLTSAFELNFLIRETQAVEEADEDAIDSDVDFEALAALFAQKLIENAEEKKKALIDEATGTQIEYEPLKAKPRRVTKTGILTIDFSRDIIVPHQEEIDSINSEIGRRLLQDSPKENTFSLESTLKSQEMISVNVRQQGTQEGFVDEDADESTFEWEVMSVGQTTMDIQMYFEKPNKVSSSNEKDIVRVTFKDTNLLFDHTGQTIEEGSYVERVIPTQFKTEGEATFFGAIEQAFESVETGMFSSDVTINMLIAFLLQTLWAMVASQQIIIMMPLFNITLPANAQTIFSILFAIAEFDMIPTDKMYENMHEELEELSPPEEDTLQSKMEPLGFETTWLLSNLGSILIFFGLWLIFCVLVALLKALMRCTQRYPKCSKWLKRRHRSLRDFTYWNWPINFVRDSFIVIAICAMYNAAYASWKTKESALNSGLSVGILVVILVYPALLQYCLFRKQESLLNKKRLDENKNFAAAYADLNIKSSKSFLYPLFFFYRRILLPLSVILWPDDFILHYFVLSLTGIGKIIFIGLERPFADKMQNVAMLAEEVSILLISYHLFGFTDWIQDDDLKHALGYSVIVCVLGQLFCFLAVMFFSSMRGSIRVCRKNRAYRRHLKKGKGRHPQTRYKWRRRLWQIQMDQEDSSDEEIVVVNTEEAESEEMSEISPRQAALDKSYDSDTIFEADEVSNISKQAAPDALANDAISELSLSDATPRWIIKNSKTNGALDKSLASLALDDEQEQVKDSDSLLDALEEIINGNSTNKKDSSQQATTIEDYSKAIDDIVSNNITEETLGARGHSLVQVIPSAYRHSDNIPLRPAQFIQKRQRKFANMYSGMEL